MQFRLRPGGESKRGGRSPLLGRWGEGFQRERCRLPLSGGDGRSPERVGRRKRLALWCAFGSFPRAGKGTAGRGARTPEECKFAPQPQKKSFPRRGIICGKVRRFQRCFAKKPPFIQAKNEKSSTYSALRWKTGRNIFLSPLALHGCHEKLRNKTESRQSVEFQTYLHKKGEGSKAFSF